MHFSVESGVDSLYETVSGCYSWCKWTQFCLDCKITLTVIVHIICDPLRYQRKNIFGALSQSKCSARLFQFLEVIKRSGVFLLLFRLLTASLRFAKWWTRLAVSHQPPKAVPCFELSRKLMLAFFFTQILVMYIISSATVITSVLNFMRSSWFT